MQQNFQVVEIAQADIQHILSTTHEENIGEASGIRRVIVDRKPGYPCRVSLQDAEVGEEVILFPYEHHKTPSPYKSSGPVYVRMAALQANLKMNEIPLMLRHRLLSLRGYDEQGMMMVTKVLDGDKLEEAIENIFSDERASYIQVHNAGPGCYNCQINRA